MIAYFSISCSSKWEVNVSVTNSSGTDIDSILISASGIHQKFTTPLLLGHDTAFVIDFTNAPKVDGELKFWFYLHDGRKVYYSSYYPNGLPQRNFDMEVLSDPIKVTH